MSKCKCKDGPTKVYADHILTSNPPQFPWICKECGETGTDSGKVIPRNEYNEILEKHNEYNEILEKHIK